MCGIVGLTLGDSTSNAADQILEALHHLQHRGQDASGIAVAASGQPASFEKGPGLLSDTFKSINASSQLSGSLGLGHVRYRTTGSLAPVEAQPLMKRGIHEIVLAHNGQVSSREHTTQMPCQAMYDSSLILDVLSTAFEELELIALLEHSRGAAALKSVYSQLRGSFACVCMVDASIMVGFRDQFGIKPLILGRRENPNSGHDYMLASESIALEKLGFEVVRDVGPGEAVVIHSLRPLPLPISYQVTPPQAYAPDIFEFVYFARPESMIDGINVQQCRKEFGRALGETVLEKSRQDIKFSEINVVVPVPDTGCVSALALSQFLGVPFALGLVRSSYCNRTFITPGSEARVKSIWRKLSIVPSEFAGKNVLLVDDSIVRGGTSREIIRMARKAGARKVIFASASPAIRFRHLHGIDLADVQALVAYERSDEEVARAIGADAVVYLSVRRMLDSCFAVQDQASRVTGFETGVFTGDYIDNTYPIPQ